MNQLESLIRLGEMPEQDRKPFVSWQCAWKDKVVRMRLLTSGENEDALRALSSVPALAVSQRSIKEILVRAIVSIDGAPVAIDEDLQKYNEVHKSNLSMTEYKLAILAQCQEPVLQAMNDEYTKLANEQVEKLIGKVKNSQPTPAAEPSGKSV